MKRLTTALWIMVIASIIAPLTFAQDELSKKEKKEAKREAQRQEIDKMAKETLDQLLAKSGKAKSLYDKSYGYAVFDNFKLSLILATARGNGLAMRKDSDEKTYMRMGSVGLNLGLGGQKMQVVFLFQDKRTFDNFVDNGWRAESSADAAAGKKGASAEADFVKGMATYQFTEAGLMLQANISGTKYWKNDKLN